MGHENSPGKRTRRVVGEGGYKRNTQVIGCRESVLTWIDVLDGSRDGDHVKRRGTGRRLTYKRGREEGRPNIHVVCRTIFDIRSHVFSQDEAGVLMDE